MAPHRQTLRQLEPRSGASVRAWLETAGPLWAWVVVSLLCISACSAAATAQGTVSPPPAQQPPAPAEPPEGGADGEEGTLPDAAPAAEAAADPAAVPDLGAELADLDLGGLRETWSTTPSFVGDGCAPSSSSSTVAVGRLVIIASGLKGPYEGQLYGQTPAEVNSLLDAQYNSVQAIQASGYPAFVLPAESLGNVPGTPPVVLDVGGASPGAGITPVQSPALFTAAADNAFATSPSLNTSQYADQNPETVYDPASSGALASGDAQDAFLFYNYSVQVDSAGLIPGLNVGFTKLVENSSPIPRDRVYFNYSYFQA